MSIHRIDTCSEKDVHCEGKALSASAHAAQFDIYAADLEEQAPQQEFNLKL